MSQLSEAQEFVDLLKVAYSNCLQGKLKQAIRIGGTDFYQQVNIVQPTAEEIFKQLQYWQNIVRSLTEVSSVSSQAVLFDTSRNVPLITR